MTLPIAAVFLPLFLAQDASPPIRVDLATKGWQLGNREIKRGDILSPLAELTIKEPGDLLLECDRGAAILYTCARTCIVPVCSTKLKDIEIRPIGAALPASGPKSFSAIPSMFTSLYKRDPKTPMNLSTLAARGSAGANDAVVWQSAGTLHLGPALRRVLEGRYCLRLTRLPGSVPGATLSIAWDRSVDSEGVVQAPNLTPGVYSFEMAHLETSCDFSDPNSEPAWILVTSQTDFARTGEQWKDYSTWLRELEDTEVSPAVLLTLRRAALSFLADAIEKP